MTKCLIHKQWKNWLYLEELNLLPLIIKQKLELLDYLIDGERLLPAVVGVEGFSDGNSLDIRDIAFSVCPNTFKVLWNKIVP